MELCIPRTTVEAMKKAVRDGSINIPDLVNMPSQTRHDLFKKYGDENLATYINANFEKAMVAKKKTAFQDWVNDIISPTQRKSTVYKSMMKKIDELDKIGILDPDTENMFLQDLVAEKLGVKVTVEEVEKISMMAAKLEDLSTVIDPKTGIADTNPEYWQVRQQLDNYIKSLAPAHQLRVATSTIGRGTMLFSIKSPLTNIISNTVMGATQAFERRIAKASFRGSNGKFALEYVKRVNEIYQKSGFDISRMDAEWAGQVRLGEQITHAQGKGAVRKVGRFYEDIVFKQLMGAPDVASSSIQFADSVDLLSTRIAQQEGLTGTAVQERALEIFKDAIKIEPTTPAGLQARVQGIADARLATYTNKSGYSDIAMGIRGLLNKASGDVRLGDQLMPFVKTPANVVSVALDSAGVGAFKGLYKLPGAIKALKSGNTAPMTEAVRDFTRAGLGLTLATVLAYSINPEDFVGDYSSLTQKERDIAALKNAPYNSIKVGDKYISLDYLGPLGAAFVGIMYARKYGEGFIPKLAEYGKGAGGQLLRFPGLTEVGDIIDGTTKAISSGDLGKTAEGLTAEMVAFINARVVPGIVSDFAKGLDTQVRTATTPIEKVQAGIPILREGLQPKIDKTTGQPLKSEDLISTLLFGSRVKTAKENLVINEINRLYGEDATPAITDIERSSPRVQTLKKEIGDTRFTSALESYGKQYGTEATKLINSLAYQKLYDEDKMKELNSVRSKAVEDMLLKFTIKKTPEQLRQIAHNEAAKVLEPYFGVDDYVWSVQDPRLYTTYKEIRRLESGNAADRAKAKAWQQQYPQILSIREKIATIKKNMLLNPTIKQAYEIYNKSNPIQ